eukprot:scaffold15780_cov68-Phaeocystis_antarctica.AAC.8
MPKPCGQLHARQLHHWCCCASIASSSPERPDEQPIRCATAIVRERLAVALDFASHAGVPLEAHARKYVVQVLKGQLHPRLYDQRHAAHQHQLRQPHAPAGAGGREAEPAFSKHVVRHPALLDHKAWPVAVTWSPGHVRGSAVTLSVKAALMPPPQMPPEKESSYEKFVCAARSSGSSGVSRRYGGTTMSCDDQQGAESSARSSALASTTHWSSAP